MTLKVKREMAHYRAKRSREKRQARIMSLALMAVVIVLVGMFFDMLRRPEIYMSTYRYQLGNLIEKGDAEAIEYYNNTYLSHDVKLFD